jgi:hypothetical protein
LYDPRSQALRSATHDFGGEEGIEGGREKRKCVMYSDYILESYEGA